MSGSGGLMGTAPIGSNIWIHGLQLVNCLRRIRSLGYGCWSIYGLVVGGVPLEVGFEVSKKHMSSLVVSSACFLQIRV